MVKNACKDIVLSIKYSRLAFKIGLTAWIFYIMLCGAFGSYGLMTYFSIWMQGLVIFISSRFVDDVSGLMLPLSDDEYKRYVFVKSIICSLVWAVILTISNIIAMYVGHNRRMSDNISVLVLLILLMFLLCITIFVTIHSRKGRKTFFDRIADIIIILSYAEWFIFGLHYYGRGITLFNDVFYINLFVNKVVNSAITVNIIFLVFIIFIRYKNTKFYEYEDIIITPEEMN